MDKNVVVFGAGEIFRKKIEKIEKIYPIVAILDNGADKLVQLNYNYPLYKPDFIKNMKDILIILTSDYVVDIVLQLCDLMGDDILENIYLARLIVPESLEEKYIANRYECLIRRGDSVICKFIDGKEYCLDRSNRSFAALYRTVTAENNRFIRELINVDKCPVDDIYGFRRGKPIDRYYIERFLSSYQKYIRGCCLEISENTYTKRYGGERVTSSVMLHVQGWGDNVIKGNLETGEGLNSDTFDTMIITQTLMFIYDIYSVVNNIYRSLKWNGCALITVSGISQISRYDDDNWGMYHAFYEKGLQKLFYPVFGEENTEIIHYGNVKSAMSFLYGVTTEELSTCDLDYEDYNYPVIYGIYVRKK